MGDLLQGLLGLALHQPRDAAEIERGILALARRKPAQTPEQLLASLPAGPLTLLVLIGLHVAAIVFYLVIKRTNLIGPMFTGRRSAENVDGPSSGIAPVPLWRFAIGVVLAVAAVWLVSR